MITLNEYLDWRSNSKRNCLALSRIEAVIIGIPYPLHNGWVKRFGDVLINGEQEIKLKETLTEKRRSIKLSRKERKKELKKLNEEKALKYGWVQSQKEVKSKTAKSNKKQRPPDVQVNSDAFLMSFEWRKTRMQALKKYGAKCMCCGATQESGAIVNVDHIKPRKLFPQLALDLENLQILCHECNHGKGNWDMTDWRPKLTNETF